MPTMRRLAQREGITNPRRRKAEKNLSGGNSAKQLCSGDPPLKKELTGIVKVQ